jgi:hypothetical protein
MEPANNFVGPGERGGVPMHPEVLCLSPSPRGFIHPFPPPPPGIPHVFCLSVTIFSSSVLPLFPSDPPPSLPERFNPPTLSGLIHVDIHRLLFISPYPHHHPNNPHLLTPQCRSPASRSPRTSAKTPASPTPPPSFLPARLLENYRAEELGKQFSLPFLSFPLALYPLSVSTPHSRRIKCDDIINSPAVCSKPP